MKNEVRTADELAIRAVLASYCRGVDRRDWELVRSCYHQDAFEDHGAYRGTVDGFIEWVTARHLHMVQSMHFIGNVFIEFHDDDAFVETYALNYSETRPPNAPPILVEAACRYADHFQCRNGDWRIVKRVLVHEQSWAPRELLGVPEGFVGGSRTADDPTFGLRSEVRAHA